MVMGSLERLDPPRTLGGMRLVARLGEGGMASVYLAAVGEGPLARPAAVKLLRPDLADAEYRDRFLDEAKLVVRLHHNNLVDARAAGEERGQLYIAMELVDGRDLADVWDRCAERGRAFPVPLGVFIVREMLRGLHYAHTQPGLGLVHRDVSPSNVLIDWAGAVRLADFGLATSALKAVHTLPGVVFGKVGYMAPEQARREPLDGRADVYACGAILWELLTGRPLRAPDDLDTRRVSQFRAMPPSTYSGRVDEDLDAIVLQSLAPDRNQRFQNAKAFMNALGRWLSRHAPNTTQDELAEFMASLFGDVRSVERREREDLLGIAAHSAPAPSASTRSGRRSSAGATELFAPRVPTDPVPTPERSGGVAQRSDGVVEEGEETRKEPSAPPMGDDEHIPAGTVIAERYRILSRLGKGGMGTVYLGEHLTVGRSVAVKVLTHDWSRHEGVASRFRAEARAASAAGHPNIVEVFDAGELPDGRLYLVMEFLTGRNLFEEIEATGPLEVGRACRVMRDVGRAVRAAHEVGIIHRDLKPDNVMLAQRGGEGEFVKVLDFGISASSGDGEQGNRLTMPGHALGTPDYMAPEQCRGHTPSEQFDIYALGVIFHEVLTGHVLFEGLNAVDVMARKSTEDAPSVASRRSELPPALVQLIDDCVAIDPAARPASVRVFLARLDEVLRALPRASAEAPAAVAGPAPIESPPGRSSGVVFAVLGGLAAAAVVVGALWMFTAPPASTMAAAGTEPPRADGSGQTGTGTGTEVEPAPEVETPASAAEPPAPAVETPEVAPEPAPDTAPSPVAEPIVEPAPSPTPEPQPTSAKMPTPEPTPIAAKPEPVVASAPEHETEACATTREAAAAARSSGDYKAVLKHVKKKACWASRRDRARLETKALAELGRWKECVSAAKGQESDKQVARTLALCEARAQ